jgi:hypothetical protein
MDNNVNIFFLIFCFPSGFYDKIPRISPEIRCAVAFTSQACLGASREACLRLRAEL